VVTPVTGWFGTTAAWWVRLERDARRRLGPALRHWIGPEAVWQKDDPRVLVYYIDGMDVVGDARPVDVEIRFYADPPYDTYGLAPEDYPRVFANRGATSPHRMPDGSLCIWYPWDPPHRRWTAEKGLLELVELTRQHLFLENYWRRYNIWPVEDSPHGPPRQEGGGPWPSPKRSTQAGRRRRARSSSPRSSRSSAAPSARR
jgi:hypothetical protein